MKQTEVLVGDVRFVVLCAAKEVETHFPDGHYWGAQRIVTPETLVDNVDLGYPADDKGCWQSLIEHELAHSLICYLGWGRYSRVLRHECGAERYPYYERILEEAVVLAFQRYIRTGEITSALFGYANLNLWQRSMANLLKPIYEAVEEAWWSQ